jgi:hypothetical protein
MRINIDMHLEQEENIVMEVEYSMKVDDFITLISV